MENTIKNISLVLGILLSFYTHAQINQKLVLLDEETKLPIQGASFQYGNQTGFSSEKGEIRFQLSDDLPMLFSHVNYGQWEITAQEVVGLLSEGFVYRQSVALNLYPVTVIAVNQSQDGSSINIDYEDRLQHDAAAVLNQTPAINSIRKSGNYGFDPVLRGFKYDQLNIVLNGAQSATAACPNRMDPPTSQMAPNMIDRVEILKGPHALRYGTGFGGTINFIPSGLRFSDNRNLYGRFSSEYQQNGSVFRNEGQIGIGGQKYDLSFFGSWARGNDYKAGNGKSVQSDFTRGSFGSNLGFKLNSKQQLRLSVNYNLARDTDFPALPMDLRTDDTWMFNARHDIMINKRYLKSWNTTLFGSFVDHKMNNLLKNLDPRMLNAETIANTYNYGGRTEGIWNFETNKLFMGADLKIEGAEGFRTREFLMGPNAGNTVEDNAWQNGRIQKTGVFSEYHLFSDQFKFVFSGRLEFNTAIINDPSDEFTQINSSEDVNQVNPNLSVGVLRPVGEKSTIGLWLGRAQRSGSLTERFINFFPVGQDPYEMLGNPDLLPEKNNQIDVSWSINHENTNLDVDVFASYLQDYISSIIDPDISPRLPMSPGVRTYINIEEAFSTGFEINWTQRMFQKLEHQFGIAYTYAQDLERDEPLPEIAPLDVRYTLRGLFMDRTLIPEVTFRYVAAQERASTEFGESITPSFALLDAKITYQVIENIGLRLGVNNLLDKNYYEHLNRSVRGTQDPIFAPGRNIYGSVNVRF